jgi:hypothetical protein
MNGDELNGSRRAASRRDALEADGWNGFHRTSAVAAMERLSERTQG